MVEKTTRIEYNGHVYYLYKRARYFQRHARVDGKDMTIMLHREIWEDVYGKIPEGYQIHHKDGNKLNNAIENLECVSIKEHKQAHPEFTDWVRSEEGRKYNSEMTRRKWDNTPLRKKHCAVCGKEFTFLHMAKDLPKFCSDQCRRYHQRTELYAKTFVCEYCGKEFAGYKYHNRRFCSRSCAGLFRYRRGIE